MATKAKGTTGRSGQRRSKSSRAGDDGQGTEPRSRASRGRPPAGANGAKISEFRTITIRLEPDVIETLDEMARVFNKPLASFTRELVAAGLAKVERTMSPAERKVFDAFKALREKP